MLISAILLIFLLNIKSTLNLVYIDSLQRTVCYGSIIFVSRKLAILKFNKKLVFLFFFASSHTNFVQSSGNLDYSFVRPV